MFLLAQFLGIMQYMRRIGLHISLFRVRNVIKGRISLRNISSLSKKLIDIHSIVTLSMLSHIGYMRVLHLLKENFG